jgi:hypothetical protein
MGLVGADLAELRTLVTQLSGPLQADLNGILTRMNDEVQRSSSYWAAEHGDKFRADFAGFVRSTTAKLDDVLQQASRITGQNLAAIEKATESSGLEYYVSPARLLPDLGNLVPNSMGHITSDEEGSLYYGSAAYLFSKYGSGHQIMLPGSERTPWPVVPRVDNLPPTNEITEQGGQWVKTAGGLWGQAGTPGVDPRVPLPPTDLGAGWKSGVDSGLKVDPVNVPAWADYGAKGLNVVGAGLTLYSQWEDTWQSDQALHPNWSTPERIADAAGQTVVVGGETVDGALAGAEFGAETGAELGAAVGSVIPGLGTAAGGIVGGLVGAVAGGFVGSQVGRAAGQALWGTGKAAVSGVEDLGKGAEDLGKDIWHGLGL